MPYSSPPPSPDDREPVTLGVPRKSKRLGRARQARCPAERGTRVEASERREILGSVKSSCPFARDPRRRRGRMRSSHSLPTGPVPCGGRCRWIPPRPTFPLNLTSQARTKRPPKKGEVGRTLYLLFPASQKLRGPPRPEEIPLHPPADAKRAALARQPACTGDNDGRVRRLCPGGKRDGGSSCPRTGGLTVGSPPRVQEEPAPRGAGSPVEPHSERSLVGVPPNW